MTKPDVPPGEIGSTWRFEAKCAICEAKVSSEVEALGYFMTAIKAVGWSNETGKWVCPYCVKKGNDAKVS